MNKSHLLGAMCTCSFALFLKKITVLIPSPISLLKKLAIAIITPALCVLANTGYAASITWSAIQDDTGLASDVLTTGILFDAKTINSSNVTLNGVNFLANPTNIAFSGATTTYFYSPPPTSWDDAYRALVTDPDGSGTGGFSSGGFDIDINNLTVGDDYLVQLWNPYWDFNWQTGYTAGNFSGFLNSGCNGVECPGSDATGQFVTGTFTADAVTQEIHVSGLGSASQPSCPTCALTPSLQVRSISNVPIPPAILLFTSGLLGLVGAARRKKT